MELSDYRPVVEALLFACGDSVSAAQLGEAVSLQTYLVEELLLTMKQEYERPQSGLRLLQLEDRWQLVTKNKYGPQIKTILDRRRNTPLSQASMEVLAIIAYNQPVTRGFIEQVRGVDSSTIVTKLVEKGLIEEAGRLDLPGRPIAFRTTDNFLLTFGIETLGQLPRLHADSPQEQEEPRSALNEPFVQTEMHPEEGA